MCNSQRNGAIIMWHVFCVMCRIYILMKLFTDFWFSCGDLCSTWLVQIILIAVKYVVNINFNLWTTILLLMQLAMIAEMCYLNLFNDEQPFYAPQKLTSFPFGSLFIFCLGSKMIGRRAARRLIILHPKQHVESELKLKTCFGTVPIKFSCSSMKELMHWNGLLLTILKPTVYLINGFD